MAKILGNRGAYYRGNGANGGLVETNSTRSSWVHVNGKAGEVVYLGVSRFQSSSAVMYAVQATGSVTIYYTLSEEAAAQNPDPDVQAHVPWGNEHTPTVNEVEPLNGGVLTNAIKIVFDADADVYIAGR